MKSGLSREIELLLLLSRVSPGAEVLTGAQHVIDGGIDWSLLFSLSGEQGTFNLVYKNLESLRGVPADVLGKFEHSYNNTLRRNVLNVSEHDRVIEGLHRMGAEVISLKGPPASEEILGDIGLYPSDDIDILIRVEDIDRVRDFLGSGGYTLLDKGFDEYRDFFIRELYHVSFSKGGRVIEPHWNLFFRYFTTPPEFWWKDSRIVAREERTYRFLSPEKDILYNSFRLFSKSFRPLRFLVMVAELIRHYREEIDWEKMFLYARRHKFEKTLRTVLMMSVSLLGAPVPGGYAEIKGHRTKLLYSLASKMVLSGNDPHPVHKVMLAFLRDDLAGSLKVLFRRLFPSMGEIVSRYRLSDRSARAVFYYMLNPLFLCMRRRLKI